MRKSCRAFRVAAQGQSPAAWGPVRAPPAIEGTTTSLRTDGQAGGGFGQPPPDAADPRRKSTLG